MINSYNLFIVSMEESPQLDKYRKLIQAIENVSPTRRYQTRLIIFFLVIFLALHFSSHMIAYLFNNAVFQCTYSSSIVEQKVACEHLDTCTIKNYYSLTAHLNLYCGARKNVRNMIKSMKGIGIWIGLAFMGVMSDKYGKRRCIITGIFAVCLWFVFIMGGSLFNDSIMLALSQISFGFGYVIIQSLSYIYITRFLDKGSYEKLTVGLFLSGTGVSLLLQGVVTSFVKDWVLLLSASALPMIILLPFSYFLQEDPYFYLQTGRTQECQKVIRSIGVTNGADEDVILAQEAYVMDMHLQPGEDHVQLLNVVKTLPRNIELLKLVVILGVVYLASHVSEASFNFTAQEVGYSYQSNISIMGIAAILSNLTFIFVLDCETQRKRGFIWITTIQASLSFLYLTYILQQSRFLQACLLFVLKFMKCWGMNFYTRLKVDCLPKRYQGTLTSIILLIGKTAPVIDPHVIQWQSDHGLNVMISNYCIKFILGTCLLMLITQKYYQLVDQEEYSKVTAGQEILDTAT